MRRRGYFIFACILALLLVGCGHKEEVQETNNTTIEEGDTRDEVGDSDTVVENTDNDETKTTTEEKTTNNTEETIQNPSTGTTTEKKESTTTTQKPATNNNTTSNNTSNNSNNTTPNTNDNTSNNNSTTPKPTQPVHEHNWVEVTEDEIHYYAWRTLCGKCNADLTDLSGTDRAYHTTVLCRSGYSTHYIEVDFVTENVVKTPVVVGYKCSCGAEKE